MAATVPNELVVVGAGAAGFMAAITAAEAGASVRLLNSHPQPGLKILMSGGTRCNVTHDVVEPEAFHGGSRAVLARLLREFPADATRDFFERLGVALKVEPGGKCFPVSNTARTVLEALLARSRALGVRFEFGVTLTGVRHHLPGGFQLELGGRHDTAGALLLATGGLSFPRTGSDGTGYALARALGHTLVEPVPALTPLTLAGPWPERLKGLTLPAVLVLHDGARRVRCAGSLLWTHFGLSGPAALDISRHWLRADPATRRLTLHLLPDGGGRELSATEAARAGLPAAARTLTSEEQAAAESGALPGLDALEAAWLAAAGARARLTLQGHLTPRLPARLLRGLAEAAGVEPARPLSQIPRDARRRLLTLLVAFPLDVSGTRGFGKAEVTAGGIPLAEIDPRTMMSRRTPGLFLAGEILDVDGRLGGYNFQWAWSSGRVAGRGAVGYLCGAAAP